MDGQVLEIIEKIHQLLKQKANGAQLTTTEMAYITGLLEAILSIFRQPEDERPDGFFRRILP